MAEETPPTDDLIRMGSRDVSVTGDGMTMTGYPIVFNEWTTINSWEGRFRERIAPSALRKTLAERGDRVKVLFNHGMDPDIGDKPLGKPAVMRTDERGLYVEVPLSDTSYNRDLAALLRDGAIDGMSFRFSVPKAGVEWEYPKDGLPKRTITELNLAELGPVTFPAYEATTVGIRSREDLGTWKGLTDSKRARVRQVMADDDSDDDPADLAEAVDAVIDALGAAIDAGDLGQAAALCTAADVAVDKLILLLGGEDADDEDSPAFAMYSAKITDFETRTTAARQRLAAALTATTAASRGTAAGTSKIERQAKYKELVKSEDR